MLRPTVMNDKNVMIYEICMQNLKLNLSFFCLKSGTLSTYAHIREEPNLPRTPYPILRNLWTAPHRKERPLVKQNRSISYRMLLRVDISYLNIT